jgi:hypothetical protein
MRKIIGSTAAILAIAALGGCGQSTSSAQASDGQSAGETVVAVGCPAQPKAGCVTIASAGKTYDITDAGVDLSKGVAVSLSGVAKGEMGACGPKLSDVQVDYQSLSCGPPAAAAK